MKHSYYLAKTHQTHHNEDGFGNDLESIYHSYGMTCQNSFGGASRYEEMDKKGNLTGRIKTIVILRQLFPDENKDGENNVVVFDITMKSHND